MPLNTAMNQTGALRPAPAQPRDEGAWRVFPLEGALEIRYHDVAGNPSRRRVIARELKNASIKMVGLERGRRRDTVPDFQSPAMHDELHYAVRHGLMQNFALETVTMRNTPDQEALPYRQIGSFLPGTDLGGAGVHWNGQTWRFQEADFRLRSHHEERYGKTFVPEELAIQDWGITYQDLEPYYDRFERMIGAGGYAGNINGQIRPGGNPFEAPRSRDWPNPPTKPAYLGVLFANAAMELGYSSTSAFVYAFRTETGCSPQAYMRERMGDRAHELS